MAARNRGRRMVELRVDGNEGHEGRISSLETAMVALAGDVKDIAHLVRDQNASLSAAIRDQSQQSAQHYEQLSSRLRDRDKPQWGVYFAGLSLLLAFVMAIGAAALAPVYLVGRRNEADIASARDELRAHVELEGHPTAMAMHAAESKRSEMQGVELQRSLRDLDEKLQREMNLALSAEQARIAAMDEKLQLEIGVVKDAVRVENEAGTLRLLIEALKQSQPKLR